MRNDVLKRSGQVKILLIIVHGCKDDSVDVMDVVCSFYAFSLWSVAFTWRWMSATTTVLLELLWQKVETGKVAQRKREMGKVKTFKKQVEQL